MQRRREDLPVWLVVGGLPMSPRRPRVITSYLTWDGSGYEVQVSLRWPDSIGSFWQWYRVQHDD